MNLLLSVGQSKPQNLLQQQHNVKAHVGVSRHRVWDLGMVCGCAGGSWKLEEFKVQFQVCQRYLCCPPTMAQQSDWRSRVVARASPVLGSFAPHVLSSLDTPAPPHTPVTPAWPDTSQLSPCFPGVLKQNLHWRGRHIPSLSHWGFALPARP